MNQYLALLELDSFSQRPEVCAAPFILIDSREHGLPFISDKTYGGEFKQ
jgi:hypothetical protein